MYLIFVGHYNIRPCKAQYLYWYLHMLEKFPDAYFVVTDDYLNFSMDRWEVKDKLKVNPDWKYYFPKKLVVIRRPEEVFSKVENPSDILRECVSNINYELGGKLERIVRENKIDAIITCCNNKTLLEVGKEHNISVPVIHNEQGPLRPPFFNRTAYFDFSGVNGNTEFYQRFLKFGEIAHKVNIYSREDLLRIVTKSEQLSYVEELSHAKPTYNCGVALQVDVDTNMIAYNKGWSSTDLINKAMKDHGTVLIRNHPLASMQYSATTSLGNGVIDTSSNSLEFISKCKKIMTINSSVAFEAMLMGREVEILGDSPFARIPNMLSGSKLLALNFAVFSYLVPNRLWDNEEYTRFRLNEKDEEVLYNEGQKLVLEGTEWK